MLSKKTIRFSPDDVAALAACRNYIRAWPQAVLTIKILSRKVGLNEQKLKAGFKLLFARSIHQELMQCRMQRALHLLATTNDPVKSIAGAVGYKPRNFYQAFARFYGCSPHRWRCNQPPA